MKKQFLFGALLTSSLLTACPRPNPIPDPLPEPSPSVNAVTVTPSTVTLVPGGTQLFKATVSTTAGALTDVRWQASGGTVSAATGNEITYTAPTTEGTYTLTATSTVNQAKTSTATITVKQTTPTPSVSVTTTPTEAKVTPGQTVELTATVTGSSNTAVTWKTSGGQLTPTGNKAVFTAPTAPGAYTVTATSVADPSKSSTSTVTVEQVAVQTGTLQVNLSGLPGGSTGTVEVTGPNGYSQDVSSNTTLAGLAPGQYTVTGKDVTVGNAVYSAPAQTVTVTAGQTMTTAVVYAVNTSIFVVTTLEDGIYTGINPDPKYLGALRNGLYYKFSTIRFAPGLSGTIVLWEPMDIPYNVSIEGNGQVTIKSDFGDRVVPVSNEISALIRIGSDATVSVRKLTLDGSAIKPVHAFTIILSNSGVLSATDLIVENGPCSGIYNGGQLELLGMSAVIKNSDCTGENVGGILNGGKLIVSGGSRIADNSGSMGGGILTRGPGVVDLRDNAQVTGNTSRWGGGVTMDGFGRGPGTLLMSGNARITGNRATSTTGNYSGGGGVWSSAGVTLQNVQPGVNVVNNAPDNLKVVAVP